MYAAHVVYRRHTLGGAQPPTFLRFRNRYRYIRLPKTVKVKKKRWYIPEGTFLKGDPPCISHGSCGYSYSLRTWIAVQCFALSSFSKAARLIKNL